MLANDIGKEENWQHVNNKSWLLDSGSTIHVTNDLEDLINTQDINVEVKQNYCDLQPEAIFRFPQDWHGIKQRKDND